MLQGVCHCMWPTTLAYGCFSPSHINDDVARAITALAKILLLTAVPYVPSSIIAEQCRGWKRLLAPCAYIVLAIPVLPFFQVLGEYGPEHVALHVGAWLLPLGFVLVLSKTVVRVLVRDTKRPEAHNGHLAGHRGNSTV